MALTPLPPVSVIMPVYNGERYVAKAIESVLYQTHQDFEFIIVNDGSTDRTPEILDGYAIRDGRIRVIHQTNMDQPASLNRALAEAQNTWVAVLDADDVCMPHRLETQLRALQRLPAVRVLGAYAIRIDERGKEIGMMTPRPTTLAEYEELIARGDNITLVHPSAMMHRPTILSLGGYDPDFGPAADSELWSRVADNHVVMSLPEPLLYYRSHSASMSATRFFEQRLMLRWLQVRQHARRRGRPEPTLEEYKKVCRGRRSLNRLNHLREDWGEYLRANSRLAWRGGRRLRALLIRAAALALDPSARRRSQA
jgi:glycosyltransferase involved in cell wall biosynthesis